MTIGIIILIVTLACFVALGILALTWGRKYRFPDGHRFEAEVAGNKVIVFVDERIPTVTVPLTGKVLGFQVGTETVDGRALANSCALAIHATELAFKGSGVPKADIDTLVVSFKTDEVFEGGSGISNIWKAYLKVAAAYSAEVIRNVFGSTLPLAVVRTKYLKMAETSGKPIIHELVHILNKEAGKGYSSAHKDETLWAVGGDTSIERQAEKRWRDMADL